MARYSRRVTVADIAAAAGVSRATVSKVLNGRADVAEETRAETIVLGNRGTHGSRWRVRETVPNLVLRHAPCSVYIVDTRRAQ